MTGYPEIISFTPVNAGSSPQPVVFAESTASRRNASGNTEPRSLTTSSGTLATWPSASSSTALTDHLLRILEDQTARFSSSITKTLSDQTKRELSSEDAVSTIARQIELLGETGYFAAYLEAHALKPGTPSFESLLLAIATADHRDTEAVRVRLLRKLAFSSNGAGTRSAVRALGQMNSQLAKHALREIAEKSANLESARLASSYLK
jgi:hypothetical protein